MSACIGIIGGTGLQSIVDVEVLSEKANPNKFGTPSSPLAHININGAEAIFIARHGAPHQIPPHKINYRANIYALKESGVNKIISVNAVGGITSNMAPGSIVLPNQIIDYTYSRKHTFFDNELVSVTHTDFTFPYSDSLKDIIIKAASVLNMKIINHGTYAATQGPRLETAAEINRLESDGCDIVGMTGMPEASLARELNLDYASICLVVNWAAGKTDDVITMELIYSQLETGMKEIIGLLKKVVNDID